MLIEIALITDVKKLMKHFLQMEKSLGYASIELVSEPDAEIFIEK
ncbi:hypothetical protein [Aureibacter tunicatorum]|uniref:Uncharacterized protein n=1 Tax=Aureibacter tunicatorum TaxID=866807 RepID=A0AAE4BTP3_9BACT|nr:hypothetical protein [Aureibacter tunicatorum]MDR6240013.1 hypothetical protein [Aureibacter tunicatorum]BDD04485.1 hypothetical protein AUTU_19680 [Aureibacter tunicatorum]